MIVSRLSDNFSEIGTVVFYRRHKFFPQNFRDITDGRGVFKSDLIKYHGSDKNFPSLDFAEYNFSYFPDKYKFNNSLFLSELDYESAEIIGRDIKDTSKVGDVLFPTLVEEETNNPYNYFGSLIVGGRLLYFFECPEEYATIEIYESILSSNIIGGSEFIEYEYLRLSGEDMSNIVSPAAIINLGPSNIVFNNPTELYYPNDPMKSRANRKDENGEIKEYSTLEYSRLYDEITSKKVISFFLSPNSDTLEFNVSYSAWEYSSNPLRNKWKYDLRNDEFFSILDNPNNLDKKGDIVIDNRSGTILGNSSIPNSLCPIRENKLSKLSRYQSNYYSPYRKYYKGENTIYNVPQENGIFKSYVFESLVNGNIGNDPLLSPAWILRDRFLDFLTNIIYISTNPEETGSVIDPGTQITVRGTSVVDFSISEGVGYKFSGVSIINKDNDTIDLIENENYTYTLEDTDTEYLKTVRIDSWGSYIDPGDINNPNPMYTSNLVFNFIPSPSILKITVNKDNNIYSYSDWETIGITSLVVRLDGIELSLGDENSPLAIVDGNMYLFISNPISNPVIEIEVSGDVLTNNVVSNYRIGSHKYTKTIEFSDNTVSDIVNFSDAEWILNLSSRTRYISLRHDSQIVCSIPGLVSVEYGSTFVIPFKSIVYSIDYLFPYVIDIVNFDYDENDRLYKYDNDILINYYPYSGELILNGNSVANIVVDVDPNSENGRTYDLILSNITENIMIQISK